jgi:adenylosuccinate synthase
MSKLGNEFGTTTGRPRRTGWLDLVALKESQRINGYTGLVITKVDVLGDLDEILYCISYSLDGKEIDFLPTATEDLSRCKPIYRSLPGFQSMTGEEWISLANKSRKGQGIEILPNSIRNYLKAIEDFVGVPVVSVGVGPDRLASIASTNGPFDFEIPEATF